MTTEARCACSTRPAPDHDELAVCRRWLARPPPFQTRSANILRPNRSQSRIAELLHDEVDERGHFIVRQATDDPLGAVETLHEDRLASDMPLHASQQHRHQVGATADGGVAEHRREMTIRRTGAV